jgi:hypothetical protein
MHNQLLRESAHVQRLKTELDDFFSAANVTLTCAGIRIRPLRGPLRIQHRQVRPTFLKTPAKRLDAASISWDTALTSAGTYADTASSFAKTHLKTALTYPFDLHGSRPRLDFDLCGDLCDCGFEVSGDSLLSHLKMPGVTACQMNTWLRGNNRPGRLNTRDGCSLALRPPHLATLSGYDCLCCLLVLSVAWCSTGICGRIKGTPTSEVESCCTHTKMLMLHRPVRGPLWIKSRSPEPVSGQQSAVFADIQQIRPKRVSLRGIS